MSCNLSAYNCEQHILVRRCNLSGLTAFIDEYFGHPFIPLYQGKLYMNPEEDASGWLRVEPYVGSFIFFHGENPYGILGTIARMLADFCETGSVVEVYDEDYCQFHRIEKLASGEVVSKYEDAVNPFHMSRCATPIDNVVESVVWEDFVSTLGIRPDCVPENERELAVRRAVKAYRRAIDDCMSDTRHDLFAEALESIHPGILDAEQNAQ